MMEKVEAPVDPDALIEQLRRGLARRGQDAHCRSFGGRPIGTDLGSRSRELDVRNGKPVVAGESWICRGCVDEMGRWEVRRSGCKGAGYLLEICL